MSTFLRTLGELVLGETWTLPLGVALVLITGALLREVAPGFWEDAGGFVLLGGVVTALLVAVRGGA
jgi:hypothetical protein